MLDWCLYYRMLPLRWFFLQASPIVHKIENLWDSRDTNGGSWELEGITLPPDSRLLNIFTIFFSTRYKHYYLKFRFHAGPLAAAKKIVFFIFVEKVENRESLKTVMLFQRSEEQATLYKRKSTGTKKCYLHGLRSCHQLLTFFLLRS